MGVLIAFYKSREGPAGKGRGSSPGKEKERVQCLVQRRDESLIAASLYWCGKKWREKKEFFDVLLPYL